MNKSYIKPQSSLFNPTKIPQDAKEIISSFNKIVISSKNLSSKQISLLPKQIRELSHELTDERGNRHLGYMNKTTTVSAYIYYYMWWNLIRLTKLFSNIPEKYFLLNDGDVCLDIGSGPLTVPIALFLAHPELRTKKLTWYCTDISSIALTEGENLFLTIAAKLKCEPWKIIRVKGELGTSIKQKASLITAANVFNEIVEDQEMPPDFLSKKYTEKLLAYTDTSKKSSLLIIEPGVPKTARFISLLRDSLMRKNYFPVSPCTHCDSCPMEGKRGGKWCNFAFSTDDAPVALKKLSEAAHLPKERAVLSYIFATNDSSFKPETSLESDSSSATAASSENGTHSSSTAASSANRRHIPAEKVSLRIASDSIHLPANFENGVPYSRTGYYACSSKGLLLVITKQNLHSGEEFVIEWKEKNLTKDKKTGALTVEL